MAAPTINGSPLLECRIVQSITGPWTAEAQSDGSEALAGKVTIVLDGATFVGTVERSKEEHGRVISRIVGGAGGLSKELDAKAYANSNLVPPLTDVLRETGEVLSSTAVPPDLFVGTWQRCRGAASAAIKQIAYKAGLNWRVLRDGTIWIGTDTWPEASVGGALELDTDWSDGVATFADGVGFEPGTTYAGQRINQVTHLYSGASTKTEVSVASPAGMIDKILDVVRRELDFAKIWRCQVVSQAGDGTLELLPDSPRLRGTGIAKVKIAPGLAGTKVTVPQGAVCFVAFDGGDPSKPFVLGWESETGMSLTTLGAVSQAQFAARADKVDALLSNLKTHLNAHVHPTGVGPSGVPTTIWQASGPATVACSRLKVE